MSAVDGFPITEGLCGPKLLDSHLIAGYQVLVSWEITIQRRNKNSQHSSPNNLYVHADRYFICLWALPDECNKSHGLHWSFTYLCMYFHLRLIHRSLVSVLAWLNIMPAEKYGYYHIGFKYANTHSVEIQSISLALTNDNHMLTQNPLKSNQYP